MAAEDFTVQPLIDGWRLATDDVKREVSELVDAAAARTAGRVESAYPQRRGGLRRSVVATYPRGWRTDSGGYLPARLVRVLAPHVHFIEEGTNQRFDNTRRNANRGRTPKQGPIFVRIVVEERQDMLRDAQALLDRSREVV